MSQAMMNALPKHVADKMRGKSATLQITHEDPSLPRMIWVGWEVITKPGFISTPQKIGPDSFTFHYTLEGEGLLNYHGSQYALSPGTGILLSFDMMFEMTIQPTCKQWEMLTIYFVGSTGMQNHVNSIIRRNGPLMTLAPDDLAIAQMLTFMQAVLQRSIMTPEIAEEYLCSFFMALRQSIIPCRIDFMTPFSKILCFIAQHFQQSITLNDLATMAGLSPTHFCRVFKKQVGIGPMRYVLQVRLYHSLNKLNNSLLSINEIGRECGFRDGGHFSRTFHKFLGHSPSAYRHGEAHGLDQTMLELPTPVQDIMKPYL